MKALSYLTLIVALVGVFAAAGSRLAVAQGAVPPDVPAVTVRGQIYTPRSILARNMGSEEDHPAQYNLATKHARVKTGSPNPFIDPANCRLESEIQQAMLGAQVAMQQKGAR